MMDCTTPKGFFLFIIIISFFCSEVKAVKLNKFLSMLVSEVIKQISKQCSLS